MERTAAITQAPGGKDEPAGAPSGGRNRGEPPDVRLSGVRKTYGDVVAVGGIDLEVKRGEFFTLLGPSGSGKTTTLRMIAGFEDPDAGGVELAGRDVTGIPPYDREVNTVFQDYALFPHMTVGDNVQYGMRVQRVGKDERRRRASESTTALPVASGTDAPHMPVLPPCGTIGVCISAQVFTTAATSSVVAGRTTAAVAPR